MPWLKSEGRSPRNDKLWELSDAAYRLYDAGRHYAVENLTDGHIPSSRVSALTPKPAGKRVINELTKTRNRAPLWHELPEICDDCKATRAKRQAQPLAKSGYLVHDFLVYNPTRAEWEKDQARRRDAGRRGAEARWGDGSPHGASHSSSHSSSHSEPHGSQPSGVLSGTHAPYPVSRKTDRSTYPPAREAEPPIPDVDPGHGDADRSRDRGTRAVPHVSAHMVKALGHLRAAR